VSVDAATPTGSAGSVGDRYRLLECVAGDPDGPAVAWRAWDTLLARAVTLTMVRPGGESAQGFLGHAHAVSTVVHQALARVYDAVDEGAQAYVVSEWVTGTPFTALLREGALDPDAAAATVARVADGVAAAHAAGVAFGGVHPDHVVVTPGGTVTLAQVVGDGRAQPSDDIRGLGALLYAALTAHWPLAPTGGAAGLRQATANGGGHLLTPRQLRAGVPEDLSTLAMRALDPANPHGVRSAATMTTVLGDRAVQRPSAYAYEVDEPAAPEQQRRRWVALVVPIIAAFAVLAVVGWLVGTALGKVPGSDKKGTPVSTGASSTGGSSPSGGSSPPPSQTLKPITIRGASLFDPQGDKAENKNIEQSFDNNPATAWSTDDYKRSADFGHLKKGMGLAYNVGDAAKLGQVQVSTTTPGIDVQILAGDNPDGDVSSYQVVGQATNLTASQTIKLTVPNPARYYIVFITKLVPDGAEFKGALSEVRFLS
jgi:eukaryotic-like serine/threonine-protein kinase